MGPEALAQVLRPLAEMFDAASYPDLLRGLASPDDAAVWRLDAERAVVLTADFFPPVVDHPYHFGAIAAANALSDLYAMGARPLLGLNLVGFPETLDPAILSEILRGGGEKMKEAGAVVAGGHTTTDQEPKYGLAVLGLVAPEAVLTNAGARPGDRLLLTKPIGTGIVTTAHKRGKASDEDLQAAIRSMERLNGWALEALRAAGPRLHALTDITGFGLLGHAHEVAHESRVSLELEWQRVPLLPGAERYARKGYLTGGGARNAAFYARWVDWEAELEGWQRDLLYDPQTSGGLLAAVGQDALPAVVEALERASEPASIVGRVVEGPPGRVVVR